MANRGGSAANLDGQPVMGAVTTSAPTYVNDTVEMLSLTVGGALRTVDATLAGAIGSPDDAAWNGTDPSATVIALLKAIAINTAP